MKEEFEGNRIAPHQKKKKTEASGELPKKNKNEKK